MCVGRRGFVHLARMAERHLQVAAVIDTNVVLLIVAMATASGLTGYGARSLYF